MMNFPFRVERQVGLVLYCSETRRDECSLSCCCRARSIGPIGEGVKVKHVNSERLSHDANDYDANDVHHPTAFNLSITAAILKLNIIIQGSKVNCTMSIEFILAAVYTMAFGAVATGSIKA